MRSQATLLLESFQTGDAAQATSPPDDPARVVFCEFGLTSSAPIRGSVPLADYIRRIEADPATAARLGAARRVLADQIGEPGTLRHLRMKAGLSQAKLAALASTTQAYIARLEAGTADPGTEMLGRLARALRLDPFTVFSAVLSQRARRGAASVG